MPAVKSTLWKNRPSLRQYNVCFLAERAKLMALIDSNEFNRRELPTFISDDAY